MQSINELIKKGESETLDFKQTISSSLKIAKTLSAFANTRGGKILVGVKDNGTIAGARTEEETYMLEAAAEVFCKPPVTIGFIEERLNRKVILVADISESDKKPHYAKDENGKWWAYIRAKDKTLLASKVMLDVMRNETRGDDVMIKFGWPEKRLLEYLQNHERITQKEFCRMANISKWRANKILVNLVRMRIIKVLSHEKADYYCL